MTEISQLRQFWENGLQNILEYYVDLGDEIAYELLAIWIYGTYIFQDFECFPYLYLVGTKQSGKSKVLCLLEKLCNKAWLLICPTPASVFRLADAGYTILLDELERLDSKEQAELRSLLYNGYKFGGRVPRVLGEGKKLETFRVFCPKGLCSINRPNEVMVDRCILMEMRRTLNKGVANRNIPMEAFQLELNGKEEVLTWSGMQKNISDTIAAESTEIQKVYKELTDEQIVGRNWELWRPLLAIGKIMGEDVYSHLRNYALGLIQKAKDEDSLTLDGVLIQYLGDEVKEEGWINNKEILKELHESVEWEWVTPRIIGIHMRNLGFKPRHTKEGNRYFIKRGKVEESAMRFGIDLSNDEANEEKQANGENTLKKW